MKNKILFLSSTILVIAQIDAAEIVDSDSDIVHTSSPVLPISDNLSKEQVGWNNGLNFSCTCPFELQEKSDELFGSRQFEASARSTIAAAIHGSYDYIAFLYDIDPESHKYFTSKNPQSPEALSYYGEILLPKVIKHGEIEYIKLERCKNRPIILYFEQKSVQEKMNS